MLPTFTLTKDNKGKNRFTILFSLLIATLLFPSFLGLVSASSHVLSISPSSRSFGSVTVGSNSTQTFTIRNSGSARFTGNVSGLGGAFSCTGGCSYSLDGGVSQTVSVRFSPTSAIAYSDTANFSISGGSNDSCSATLAVPINGVCGSAEGVNTDTQPSSSLCNTGSPSSPTLEWDYTDPWYPLTFWSWSCSGSGGGNPASCQAWADAGCGPIDSTEQASCMVGSSLLCEPGDYEEYFEEYWLGFGTQIIAEWACIAPSGAISWCWYWGFCAHPSCGKSGSCINP